VIEQKPCGPRFAATRVPVRVGPAWTVLGARRAVARGVTLVELLVTMTIVAILLAIGVPAMQSFITSNELATSANELIAALNLARAEAVRCGQSVSVVVAGLGAGAVNGNAAMWNVAGCGGGPLRHGQFSDQQLQLSGAAPPPGDRFTFDALGRLVGAVPGVPYGLIICRGPALATTANQSTSRAILVAGTGRIKVAPTDPGSGMPLLVAGNQPAIVQSCTSLGAVAPF